MSRKENCHTTATEISGHVKDAAQDVAEDVSGAAEDGSVKVLILSIAIFQPHAFLLFRQSFRPTRACRPPRLLLGDGAMRSKTHGPADIPEGLKERFTRAVSWRFLCTAAVVVSHGRVGVARLAAE